MGVIGIDISHYQSDINLAAAKQQGVEFVILKIGESSKDAYFDTFYTQAKANGLKVGVYYFAHASVDAQTAWNRVKTWLGGKQLDLPIVLDMEADLASSVRKTLNTTLYLDFAKLVKANGYGCMLYCSESFAKTCIDISKISDPLWIAKYSSTKPNIPGKNVAMWQYSSAADTNWFYKKKLDKNICNVSLTQLLLDSKGVSIKPTITLPTGIIKEGAKGNAVTQLQHALNALANQGLVEDGSFGKKTTVAVRNIQQFCGLTVDGIYGNRTRVGLSKIATQKGYVVN